MGALSSLDTADDAADAGAEWCERAAACTSPQEAAAMWNACAAAYLASEAASRALVACYNEQVAAQARDDSTSAYSGAAETVT